jgi:hypothetical protein
VSDTPVGFTDAANILQLNLEEAPQPNALRVKYAYRETEAAWNMWMQAEVYFGTQLAEARKDALEKVLNIAQTLNAPDIASQGEKHMWYNAVAEYWKAVRALIDKEQEGDVR